MCPHVRYGMDGRILPTEAKHIQDCVQRVALTQCQFSSWIKSHDEWPVAQTWPTPVYLGVMMNGQ